MRRVLILLVSAMLVAGCAKSEGKSEAPPPTIAPPPTVTIEHGSIDGVVTNDDLLPLAGADVALVETGLEMKTDADGRFVVNELAPGSYKLIAQKLGFDSVAKAVDVKAGEVTKVAFALKAINLTEELFIQTFTFEGFLQCSYNPSYAFNPCEAASGANKDRYLFEVLNGTIKGGVWELTWVPATAATASKLELDVCRIPDPDDVGNKLLCYGTISSYYKYKTGTPPVIITDDKIPYKQYKKYMAGAGSGLDPAVFTYQQPFTLYGSLCFNEECPEGHTLLPPT